MTADTFHMYMYILLHYFAKVYSNNVIILNEYSCSSVRY